jgi:hypothetical protein
MDTNIIPYSRFKEALEQREREKIASPLQRLPTQLPSTEVAPRKKKQPIVLSALPGEPFPFGHEDLRSVLQRDGLILLSWAVWNDWGDDGRLKVRYVANWATSAGRGCFHYATHDITREKISSALPERKGDRLYYNGIYGNYYNTERNIADYVYLTAPLGLDHKTRIPFIETLKKNGVSVDFDFPFSIDLMKKLEFAKSFVDSTQTQRLITG